MQIVVTGVDERQIFPQLGDMLISKDGEIVYLWIMDTQGYHDLIPIYGVDRTEYKFGYEWEERNILAEFHQLMYEGFRYISKDAYLLKLVRIHGGGAC